MEKGQRSWVCRDVGRAVEGGQVVDAYGCCRPLKEVGIVRRSDPDIGLPMWLEGLRTSSEGPVIT